MTQLSIASPPIGRYWFYVMLDTSVDAFIDAFLHIGITADGIYCGEPTYFWGGPSDIPGTPFRSSDAVWDLGVQCVSSSLTLAVPQIQYVYQPSQYDEVVDSYVQDNCGEQQDPGNGYFVRAELLDGLQWGDLYDPNSGRFGAVIDSIPIIFGQGCFHYRPWGDVVTQPEQVDLKISSTLPGFAPVTQSFQVLPGSPPLEVLANRDTISYGDTTAIKFIMENSDGTPSTGQLVGSRFTIVEGDSGAFLYSPDSIVVGTDIYAMDSVLLYVPPMTNMSTSTNVKIVVSADEPCPDCGASIAVHNGTKAVRSQAVNGKTSKTAKKVPLSLREVLYKKSMQAFWKKVASSPKMSVAISKNGKAMIKSASEYDGFVTTHYGMGIVTVMAPTGCPAVVLSSNHINLGDTINVTVKMKINNTTLIDYPAGTLFDIYIINGGQYGTLLADGKTSSVGLDSVTGPIKFIAANSLNTDSVDVSISGTPDAGIYTTRSNSKSISKTAQTQTNTGKKSVEKFLAKLALSTCSEPPEAKLTVVNFNKLLPCSEQIPLIDVFKNVTTTITYFDGIVGGYTKTNLLNGHNFLDVVVPCIDKANNCVSLKILAVAASVDVVIGMNEGKPIYSENDILPSERQDALIELTAIQSRLNEVIDNIQNFTGDMRLLQLSNPDEYDRLFQLPPIGKFNFVGATLIHELSHSEDRDAWIRDAYNNALNTIAQNAGIKSASSLIGLSPDQLNEALGLPELQKSFFNDIKNPSADKFNDSEERAHEKQLIEIDRLIEVLGGN